MWFRLAIAPFHEDEAAYTSWALEIARGDWALWEAPADKPPLTLYPLAFLIGAGARAEWALRLPTLLWGLLLLRTVGRLAGRMGRSAWAARLFVVASPLWWALWASAFTDMAALALALLALDRLWSVSGTVMQSEFKSPSPGESRVLAGQSGVLMALALLAKPTMLFLLPLAAIPFLSADPFAKSRPPMAIAPSLPHTLRPWVEGFAAVMLGAWVWDASRAAPSWWRLGAEAYGTLGRAGEGGTAWSLLAAGAFAFPAVISLISRLQIGLRSPRRSESNRGELPPAAGSADVSRFRPENTASLVFAWVCLLWIPVHLVLGFQPWERYLLPLLPMLAILSAPRQAARPPGTCGRTLVWFPAAAVVAVLLVSRLGFAPQDGRWEGIQTLAAAVEALPASAELWTSDLGRPLAWYASGAAAGLHWAGDAWKGFPGCDTDRYAAGRHTAPPPAPVELALRSGDFALWRCPAVKSPP